MRNDQKIITYNGRSFNSSISKPLTDGEMQEIVGYIYREADENEVDDELRSICNGGGKLSAITRKYFLDMMYETRNGQDAWSIKEACEYKPILEYFNGKCDTSHKMMADIKNVGERFETAFRLCGIRAARKVSQFPIAMVDKMITKYMTIGGNYYDPSCGWGARMLSAMRNNVNYYGTDPNHKLVQRLRALAQRYTQVNSWLFPTFTDIRSTGSERLHEDWIGKMDFAFTSPPYFGLEIYLSDNQSYREGMAYQEWIDTYLQPTANNIYSYLKQYAYCAINIKDVVLNKVTYPLENDTIRAFKKAGFQHVGNESCDITKRVYGNVNWDDEHKAGIHENGNENIFIFQKL